MRVCVANGENMAGGGGFTGHACWNWRAVALTCSRQATMFGIGRIPDEIESLGNSAPPGELFAISARSRAWRVRSARTV